jgi:tRNA threonylcarbamoyladenosine biosynthesis protein TsaB
VPGPLTLVFETSSPLGSMLLAGPDGVCLERTFSSDRSHNAVLFSPLSELLAEVEPEQIGLILVGTGPGSYSGTRVGIAAAQGVALAAGCPVVGVPSILAAPSAAQGGPCRIVGDARRGSLWISRVNHFTVTLEPQLIDASEFRSGLEAGGDGIIATFEQNGAFPAGLEIHREAPTACLLWAAWQASTEAERERWTKEPPQPLYLRPPHITESKRPSAGRL